MTKIIVVSKMSVMAHANARTQHFMMASTLYISKTSRSKDSNHYTMHTQKHRQIHTQQNKISCGVKTVRSGDGHMHCVDWCSGATFVNVGEHQQM